VGDDSLGDAWKANVKGLPEVVAQRLVIHDTQEDAFYEELQQSVRLVLSSPPFPSSRCHHITWLQHSLQQDGGGNARPLRN
jgi:hypothetical protein